MPYPPTGKNRPELSANASSSMIPTQNDGKPRPISGTTRTTWSRTASRRLAAIAASGIAIRIESPVPYPMSHSVTGSRSTMSSRAGTR